MSNSEDPSVFDVIVIGGSYAGLSAALQVARARQRVLVIDAGVRRNRFASSSHGFLGQDGRSPAQIVADGREQLLTYPNVQWLVGPAARAAVQGDGFIVGMPDGKRHATRRLVLAVGVRDELPEIEGLAERWGQHVFHCPYCHGYELGSGRIGVLGVDAMSFHQAMLLPDWGQVTFFASGGMPLEESQHSMLERRGVTIDTRPIARISGRATVELLDGTALDFDGLFSTSRINVACEIPRQLGCAFEDGPLGAFIRTDVRKETSIPGVFACGDAARMAGSVALAVGDGAMAGAAAHQSLVFREDAHPQQSEEQDA